MMLKVVTFELGYECGDHLHGFGKQVGESSLVRMFQSERSESKRQDKTSILQARPTCQV